jgi:RsiW-degrading membrane proteinase PrsW (M82 family)
MKIAFTVFAAVAPSALLMWYFYKRDVNPEPRGVLIKTFLLGMVIVVPVLMVGLPLYFVAPADVHPVVAGLFAALILAAVPEEFFKFLVLTGYSARHPAFNEPMDGVVYGVAASLGFATLENILYVATGGWTVALLRAFTAVPAHACLGAIMGYYVGKAHFVDRRHVVALWGLFAAILLHALYDFPIMVIAGVSEQALHDDAAVGQVLAWIGVMLPLFLVVLLFTIGWTLIIVQRLRREQLKAPPTVSDHPPPPGDDDGIVFVD